MSEQFAGQLKKGGNNNLRDRNLRSPILLFASVLPHLIFWCEVDISEPVYGVCGLDVVHPRAEEALFVDLKFRVNLFLRTQARGGEILSRSGCP